MLCNIVKSGGELFSNHQTLTHATPRKLEVLNVSRGNKGLLAFSRAALYSTRNRRLIERVKRGTLRGRKTKIEFTSRRRK